MITDKDQNASVLNDMKIYVFIFMVAVVVLGGLLIFSLIKRFREKIEIKLIQVKKKFMWNGLIQSIDITYIEVCMTVGTQLTMRIKGSEW